MEFWLRGMFKGLLAQAIVGGQKYNVSAGERRPLLDRPGGAAGSWRHGLPVEQGAPWAPQPKPGGAGAWL